MIGGSRLERLKHPLWILFTRLSIPKDDGFARLGRQSALLQCNLERLKANVSYIKTDTVSQAGAPGRSGRGTSCEPIYLQHSGAPPAESISGVGSPQHQMPGDLNLDFMIVGRSK